MHLSHIVRAIVMAVALVVPTRVSAETVVECGEVVTDSVVLTADLLCDGDALIAGADGITVDLGGHTIQSDPLTGTGVRVDGYQDVTVRNGQIAGAGTGVRIGPGSHRARVEQVAVTGGEGNGIEVSAADSVVIADNTVTAFNYSILVEGSTGASITGNVIPALDNSGIRLVGSNHNLMAHNEITGANAPNLLVEGDGNRVVANRSTGSVSDNVAVIGDGNLVLNNATAGTNSWSISIRGSGNLVAANSASDAEFGFLIAGNANRVFANSAIENRRDGFRIEDVSAIVAVNRGSFNGELGFHADAPVAGVGNLAINNGDPRQCVNVRCIPHR